MRPTHAQPNSRDEANDVIARRRRPHVQNAIEVDDRAPVDARETRRVELLIESAQRLAEHWASVWRMEACVVPARLDPLDIDQSNDIDAASGLDADPLEVFSAWPRDRFGARRVL